jgi:thymidylate kinase
MNFLYQLTQNLFKHCARQNIPAALARPKYSVENFVNSDLDILVEKQHVAQIVGWLQQNECKITCYYPRSDGTTYHFYYPKADCFFHIDFITSLGIRGIKYLNIKNVLERCFTVNGIYYTDHIDQLNILIMTHGLKHGNYQKLAEYLPFLQLIAKEYPTAVQNTLTDIFGQNHAIDILDGIRKDRLVKVSFGNYLLSSWRLSGLIIFARLAAYFLNEIFIRLKMPKYKIVFLGVDGSGKTSLINELKTQLQDMFPEIKHSHLLPALPWSQEKDSGIVQTNPHYKPLRGKFASSLKLVYFLLRYWLAEITPSRKPVLYLYDRYVYDLMADPKRFRYQGLQSQSLWYFLELIPKPDLCFLLDIPADIAQTRKREVPYIETVRQLDEYRKLKDRIPNALIIKSHFPLDKISAIAKEHIIDVFSPEESM